MNISADRPILPRDLASVSATFLQKPFAVSDLIRVVREVLAGGG